MPQIPLKYERQSFLSSDEIVSRRWVKLKDIASKHSIIFKLKNLERPFLYTRDYVLIKIVTPLNDFPAIESGSYIISWREQDCPDSIIPEYITNDYPPKDFEIQWAVYEDADEITEESVTQETNQKNIIIFIGAGMGQIHHDILSMFESGEINNVPYQNDFDKNGSVDTTNYIDDVSDSASSNTSIATGGLVDNGVISQQIPIPVQENESSGEPENIPDVGDCVHTSYSKTAFIDFGSIWKYLLVDNETVTPLTWKDNTTQFDYTNWESGNAPLGYGSSFVETEIPFGADEENKNITTYFRLEFNNNQNKKFEKLVCRFFIRDGIVAYLNGKEVFRYNMDQDFETICNTHLANEATDNINSPTSHEIIFDNNLKNGINVFCVEIHKSSLISEGLFFDLSLYGLDLNLKTIAEHALDNNNKIGIITTSFINDTLPASLLTHADSYLNYNDILNQIIVKKPNILWGGGPLQTGWDNDVLEENGYTLINTRSEMQTLNNEDDYIVSNFSQNSISGHMPYEADQINEITTRYNTVPYLHEMTEKALEILENSKGFLLVVESKNIERASIENDSSKLAYALKEFNESINKAIEWTQDREDTTILIFSQYNLGNPSIVTMTQQGEIPILSWEGNTPTSEPIPFWVHHTTLSSFDNLKHLTEIHCAIRSTMIGCEISCGTKEHNMTPPIITILGEEEIYTPYGIEYFDTGAQAVNYLNEDISAAIKVIGAVNVFQRGSYTLTYSVKDENENESIATRTINVF